MPGILNILLSYGPGAGGGGDSVHLAASYGQFAYSPYPTQARARFRLATTGEVYTIRNNNPAAQKGTWFTGSIDPSDYEARWTEISETPSSGPVDTWTSLASAITWEANSTAGTLEVVGTVEIRDTATSTLQATTTVTLTADSS